MDRLYHLIGAAMGWGAQIRSCEDAPLVLQEKGVIDEIKRDGVHLSGWEIIFPSIRAKDKEIPISQALPLVFEFNQKLADKVASVLKNGEFPLVIAGDHSMGVGTWNGMREYMLSKRKGDLGLIWVDAHMDSHTLETTPSGAWHGMPLAGLLGYGEKEMSQLKRKEPVVKPEHLCLIGVRSFEEGELNLLKSLNVRIFYMDEVKSRGFETVLKEAIEIVNRGTDNFGVSLDLDVIDPKEAPGVGSPAPGGLKAKELISSFPLFWRHPKLIGLELVEYNPHLDKEDKTLHIVDEILHTLLKG